MCFYSVIEVAKLLRVNPETVRRWIREGRIGFLPGAGRQGYRITSEHLRAYVAQNPAALTPELLRELNKSEEADSLKTGKVEDQNLDVLQALRLQKIEELERIDAMIIQKKRELARGTDKSGQPLVK